MTSSVLTFDDADLHGFVDGRLEPSRAAALAESLAGDRDARARIDGWKRQNEALRSLFASVLFEPVPVRLLPTTIDADPLATQRVQHRTEVRLPPSEASAASASLAYLGLSRRSLGLMAVTSLGMALAGFVAGALTSIGTDGFGFAPLASRGTQVSMVDLPSPERVLADRAAEAHRTYLMDSARPVEVAAADGVRLLHWLQSRLAAPIRIPDLQRQGWTLVGGRVVPAPNGPAAFLVYGNGADRLGLYVARTPGLPADDMGIVEAGAARTRISFWTDETFGYALTTSRSGSWMERSEGPLRETIQAQIRDRTTAD